MSVQTPAVVLRAHIGSVVPDEEEDAVRLVAAGILRPLVLRLLAGERERCAEEAAALGDRTTAHAIRNMGDPE